MMTSRFTSAADILTAKQRSELRFLRDLKKVMRSAAAERLEMDGLNYETLAAHIGVAPAQLSRALSPDRHITTKTMWRILNGLGMKWKFAAESTGEKVADLSGNRVNSATTGPWLQVKPTISTNWQQLKLDPETSTSEQQVNRVESLHA